ncbi:MAG: hypothetical protein JSV35_07425 [Candidatus Bathyarchaeota archaeon]|nr:MAG: hypothetical protein JSV35_07425 [Candidatus Bathyarchaeota archaeon]
MLKVKFRFLYTTPKEAKSVAQAIEPDNRQSIQGLTITTATNDSILFGAISCEMSVATLASTLDDLLACVSTAESTFEAIRDQ